MFPAVVRHVVLTAALTATTAVSVAGQSPAPALTPDPVVAVWYRGGPEGVVSRDDLVAIRAYGFAAILWPQREGEQTDLVRRAAADLGLAVITAGEAQARAGAWLDVQTWQVAPDQIPARAWLAIAGGQRIVSFDPGGSAGAGIANPAGERAPWVAPALAVSRQVMANAALIGPLRPAIGVEIDARAGSSVRVLLLESGPAWVLVAANPAPVASSTESRFPKSLPFGPWVSLIDGTDMAMIDRPTHHEYRATLTPGEARVYVIDK